MKPLETTGKVSCRKPSFRRRLLSVAIIAAGQAVFSGPAQAGPEGGQVVGGRGDIVQGDRTTTVTQATDRLAVDWDSFDVDSDEIVNYIQPGSDSIALNRILSHRGSEIHGQINANGRVVLVNPHGMVFGKDAQINVGGMIASGLSVDTSDFMNGEFTFAALEGTEGAVINRGLIQASTGGSVGLLGRRVNNEGVISAELGAVNLAAGKEAVVTFGDGGLMGVRVTREILQDELGVDPALVNNGEINAAGGRVLLTASTSQDIFSQAVNNGDVGHADSVVVHDDGSFTLGGGADVLNTGTLNVSSNSGAAGRAAVLGENVTHSGVVQADSQFSNDGIGGQVELHAQGMTLVTEHGRISAQNQTGQGGNIAVLGQRVGLTEHASLNASGASGGGQILVGGDYKGQNTGIRNSQRTYLGPETVLQANALSDGDGGRVIVWADEITRYAGHLEAKGAGAHGQGGFAEVSGKEVLDFKGTASLSGPGMAGTLLLDPRDVTIARNGEDVPTLGRVSFGDMFGEPPSEDVTFSRNSIVNLLDGGTNVTLEATRDIAIAASFSTNDNNTNSLTLMAGDDIQVNADIKLGAGNIDFSAGVASCGTGCLSGGNNDLTGRSIALNGKLDTQGEVTLRAADNIQVGAAIGDTLGPFAVTALAGNKIEISSLQASDTIQLATLTEADQGEPKLVLKAGDASLVGDLASASAGPDFSKDLIIEGALHTGGASVLLNAHGAVQLDANITTQGGHLNVGDVDTQSGGYRPNSFSHTSGTINTGYGSQMMTVNGSEEELTVVGDVRIYTGVNDDSPEAGDVTLGLVDLGYVFSDVDDDGGLGRTGSIIVDAAGDFTLTSDFDFNDTGPRTGGEGSRNLASADEVAFDVTAGGSITLDAAIYDRYGDERDALEVSLNAGGTVTLNDILYTAGGNIDITGQSIAFGSGAVVDTGRAHDGTQTDTGGTELGGWSNGSNFTLDTVTGGSLEKIITRDTCTDGTCTGDLAINRSGSANSYTLGQNADTNVSIAGTTTVAVGAGTVSLDNEGNHFEGSWNLTEAGTVGIRDDGDIQVDVGAVSGPISVNTTGNATENGGSITFSPLNPTDENFTLHLGELIASGGAGDGRADGGNGGSIMAQSPTIELHGDIRSLGGEASSNGWSQDGYNGSVELTGNVKIADTVAVDLSPKNGTNNNPPAGAGNFTLIGTLDSTAGGAQDFTVSATDIFFSQAIGTTQALGTAVFNTYGKVTLGGDALPTTAAMTVNGETDGNELQAPNTSSLWTLTNSGAGSVEPDSEGTGGTVSFSGIETLRAGGNTNRFEVALATGAPDNIAFSLFGGTGEDTLVGGDVTNTWDLGAEETLNGNLSFEGIETLIGGGQTDTFKVSDGTTYSGVIDGADGANDEVDFTGVTSAVTVRFGGDGSDWDLSNINVITGNDQTTLGLASGTNTWTLDGAASGEVVTVPPSGEDALFQGTLSFTGVSALNGGSGEDTFKLTGNTAFTGAINGGGNTDTFDFTEFSTDTAIDISLGNHSAATVDLASFEVLKGHTPTQGDNTLRGAAGQAHTWTIDAENEGTVQWVNDGQTFTVDFSGFGALSGGDRGDVFNVQGQGDITGTLRGGNQLDVLDFSQKEGAIELTVGESTLGGTLSIADIESVIGHYGNEDNDTSILKVSNNSTSNTWTLTDQRQGFDAVDGVNDGVLETSDGSRLYFSNFTTLQGADDHPDEFVFSGTARMDGTLDGGGNTNTVTATGATHALSFTLRAGANADTYLQNINAVNASADHVHRLVGTNAANVGWTIDGEYRGELDSGLTFSGFKHLVGGSGEDTFTLTGDGRVEHIEGGGESDTLNLQQSNHAFQLTLAAGGEADLLLESIEAIQATSGDGHRLEGANRENTWEISGQDEGTLNSSLTFVGVDHLRGNGDTDTFKLLNGGRVSGSIDGAGQTDVEDTLDLAQYDGGPLTLTLKAHADSDLELYNLESISAPSDAGHTLIGADKENTWEITATDKGTLNGLKFVGVANLIGGSDDDTFRLLTEDSLSGVVDGAGRETENTLDLSRLSEAAFSVGSGGQFTQIDYLKGARNKTTLTAPGPDNQWRLEQGQNAGTVTDSSGQALRFTDVTDLQGGDEGNRFVFDGGWVTGWVTGGEETDWFELDLAPGTQGRLQLDGGNGANQLQVTGGGAGYEAQYRVSQSAGERLIYTDANNSVYEVAFENLAQVNDNLTAGTLQVGGTLNAEALTLRDQGYQVEGYTALYFDHKTHLSIAAESNDQLIIAGPQDLAGTLEIHNARVEQPDTDDRIKARQLRLVGIDQFGSQANPIRTAVDQLSADIGTGGLFLNNDGNLRLNRLDTRGPVDLWLAGSLTSDTALVSNQAVNLHSDLGGIRLDGDNRLTGEVRLHANGDIHLSNRESLTLGPVRADRLTLDVEGELDGQGPLVLNSAFLNASGDMALVHEDNRLQTVNLSGGGAIDLNNDVALTVNELDGAGAVHIRAQGLTMNARSTAHSLNLDSGRGDLVVQRDLSADTGLHLSGARIEQRGTLASGGELLLDAAQNIVMEAGARTSGQGEAMVYRAGGHLTLAELDNAEGTVELNAGGEVLTAFSGEENGPVNVAARRLEVQSGTGVASTSRLITRVDELSVKNQQNRVAITNSGTVRVDRMASNGNVSLRNLNGNIELDSRDSPVFDLQETDALSAGGTLNANYQQGTVSIFVDNGNLLALGMPHSHKPDLVGRRGNLIVGGDIGTAVRPLVMYFQDNLFIEGIRSWSPKWAFGQPPERVENQSSLKMSDFDLLMSGADYLVQVEELEDVDPAVFTEVRNYAYDDIAIRLPEDQHYE